MNWTKFSHNLEAAFTIRKVTLPNGHILGTRKNFKLQRVLARAATSEDERGEIESESSWGLWELLGQKYLPEPLLEFEWESGGPMSWSAQVGLLDVGASRAFMWVYQEAWAENGEAQRILAALEPKRSAEIFSAFFGSLVERNGARYGLDDLFGSLPSYTTNYRPDLIFAAAIKESYWRWMEWAVARPEPRVSWADLRDSVIRRAIDPSPLVDLGGLLSEREHQSEDDRRREIEGLSTEDRRLIFENYFSQAYRVAER